MLYAFYGSLRRGFENHLTYAIHMEYGFSMRIQGFKMYSVGDYPIVVKTQSPAETVVVEVFEIQSNKVCQEIEAMEIEAGYYIDIITLQGQKVAIFLFKESNGFKEVEGGNWHKYFKMSHK